MSVKIIVDSSANVAKSIREKIRIVPLTLRFGDDEYIDGVTIDNKMFYELLEKSPTPPSTSQATPASFETVFDEITASGDSAVVIALSSKLSGTYNSAMIAAEGHDNIYVVDGASASIGTGILAELALGLADTGKTAAEIAAETEREKLNVRVIAMLDTLEYLKRGGRISKAASIAGELLHIKPVISLNNGEIQLLGKARGSKQGNNLLVQEIEKSGGVDFEKPVLLGYTGLGNSLLQSYISDSAAMWKNHAEKLNIAPVGSIIGTHAGPGAIAAAYFKKG